jgi:hypothetical protein
VCSTDLLYCLNIRCDLFLDLNQSFVIAYLRVEGPLHTPLEFFICSTKIGERIDIHFVVLDFESGTGEGADLRYAHVDGEKNAFGRSAIGQGYYLDPF